MSDPQSDPESLLVTTVVVTRGDDLMWSLRRRPLPAHVEHARQPLSAHALEEEP